MEESKERTGQGKGGALTYRDLEKAPLEPVPPKSPYRKYLVLVALHMANSDDPDILCEAADCSERTLHYVKNRLRDHDGVVFNHDRGAKRYFVMETGVLDLPKVVEWVRKLYPNRFAYIKQLGEQGIPGEEELRALEDASDTAPPIALG